MSASDFRNFIAEREDTDVARIHYCYQLGSTFVNVALMEDTIIDAMLFCDRVKVSNVLMGDAEKWQQLLDKRKQLRNSTLGVLVRILERHNIAEGDLNYLKWIKSKRDLFVHRLFHEGGWPGDLTEDDAEHLRRRLLYLEIIFARASHHIWGIFIRAGLLERINAGQSGFLIMNPDALAVLEDLNNQ